MRSLNVSLEVRGNDHIPRLNVTVFLLSMVMIAAVKSISLGPAKGHVPNGFSFLYIRDFHRVSVLWYR